MQVGYGKAAIAIWGNTAPENGQTLMDHSPVIVIRKA